MNKTCGTEGAGNVLALYTDVELYNSGQRSSLMNLAKATQENKLTSPIRLSVGDGWVSGED